MALSNKGNFKIGTHEFSPKSLKITYDSLATEDSGRTADGIMHLDFIFHRIVKLQIEMPAMTATEANALLSLVQGQTYSITYFDIATNAEVTTAVYTSNSSADCYSGVVLNGLWTGVSFNAIELGGH